MKGLKFVAIGKLTESAKAKSERRIALRNEKLEALKREFNMKNSQQ